MKPGPIAVILGTRPEIIKMSALIRLLESKGRDYFVLHTGQHYSYDMDEKFFKDLELPAPRYKFARDRSLGPNMHEKLVSWMEKNIREALGKEKPKAVLVQGDTDTVLAGARAAAALGGIAIGHVEAGLRSYDNEMPEERNRIAADRLSHFLFAPTESAKKNLLGEKLPGRIVVTGNTIVDALHGNLELAQKKAGTAPKNYALLTLHRPESVDNKERLAAILKALETLVQKKAVAKIIFPVHPRTRQRLDEFGLALGAHIQAVEPPMGFLDFIRHEKNADVILTDSGGVQEEACILKVPCVTLRTTTERPETVEAGANVVAGYDTARIVSLALEMMKKPKSWKNPFGDGHASEKILEALDRGE